jgi:hypothetical protein
MAENESPEMGLLPSIPEKDLQAMNQLMADKQYRIKQFSGFMHTDRTDRVNSDFILYTLNDYLGHIQNCVSSTLKMLPYGDNTEFIAQLAKEDPVAARFMSVVCSVDLRRLSTILSSLQANSHEISVSQLCPFIKLLYQSLIKVFYLGIAGVTREYRQVYTYITNIVVPADPEILKEQVSIAIREWNYIFDTVFPGLYPLVLRMSAPSMMTSYQLFFTNGSKVLSWLKVQPSEVLVAKDLSAEPIEPKVRKPDPNAEVSVPPAQYPETVADGLAVLELFFPEAGWSSLESMPDLCPYFQVMLQLNDGFTQIAPENPLHQAFILFWILEELFQGLRLIKFEPLVPVSSQDDIEDINKILEEWIRYQETVFDKSLSLELKAYTHQIYTQPDFHKTPYGRKLLSNMYTLTKSMFLPHFNIQMYGSARLIKDDRLPPFYIRTARLRRVLERYYEAIHDAPPESEANGTAVPGVQNPWDPYKFDIANPLSKRLDALCGGKHSRMKTNATLIRYTLSILHVLDWWINDRTSFAYREPPVHLYRTIEPGSSVPAFGVTVRADVDELFFKHLRTRLVD